MSKRRKYWAGFCDDKINVRADKFGDEKAIEVFLRRKDARKYYEDVRPVEIKELKNG